MSKSQQLNIHDVRNIFHLIGDLRDIGAHPEQWKRLMLERLCRLIHGQVGICVETADAGNIDLTRCNMTDAGWAGEKQRNVWTAYCRRNDLSVDPSRASIMQLIDGGGGFVRLREQLCPDRDWYRDDHVQVTRKSSEVDSFIFSYQPLILPRRHHWLYLLRPWGEAAFSNRDRCLVAMFHEELAVILNADARRRMSAGPLQALSPRLRDTLALLGKGMSEKQVAAHLGCSCHTVHDYIKELHKRLGVKSRVQLVLKLRDPAESSGGRLIL